VSISSEKEDQTGEAMDNKRKKAGMEEKLGCLLLFRTAYPPWLWCCADRIFNIPLPSALNGLNIAHYWNFG
jgi:hypothetical protein